jgi:peptidoglycan hydrolase-like protein with peptidoglycan-binding domain
MNAHPLRTVLLLAGTALPFVLHAPQARAADPTINDILNTMQQLGVQIPGLGPVADCDNAENQAAVRLRDHGQSLGMVQDAIDRLQSAPSSVPPADIADGAGQIASQARQIAQDIDGFVPDYERVMISCGRSPSSSQQLSILSSSFKNEARRAESIAAAALASQPPANPPPGQPSGQPPIGGAQCEQMLGELRGAETNAASFVADSQQVVQSLEAQPPSNRRARDAGRVVEDLKARRASLNDLLTRSDPGRSTPCSPALAQVRSSLLGDVLSLQDLETRASVIAGLAPPTQTTPTPPPPAEPALTVNERTRIQQALAALSFYRGTIDADFGRGTRAAIRAWQESQGVDATGYLTRAQADRLIALQVSLPPPPVAEPTTPAPTTPAPAAPAPAPVATGGSLPDVSAADVVATLEDEIVGWSLPPQLSPAPADDDTRSFATFYERMRQRADDGDTAVVRFAAPTLAGMALLDHGTDSAELADALMLVAQIRQAEGDEAGAANLLAEARGIVERLASTTDRRARRTANAALAWIVLRQATSDLVASLIDDDRLTNTEARRVATAVDDANARIANAGDGARDLVPELRVLQAALAVAADRPPTDRAVGDEIDRLFGD